MKIFSVLIMKDRILSQLITFAYKDSKYFIAPFWWVMNETDVTMSYLLIIGTNSLKGNSVCYQKT